MDRGTRAVLIHFSAQINNLSLSRFNEHEIRGTKNSCAYLPLADTVGQSDEAKERTCGAEASS